MDEWWGFVIAAAAISFGITSGIKCNTYTNTIRKDMWIKPVEMCKINGGLDRFIVSGERSENVKVRCENSAEFKYTDSVK